jgi:diguanylate cyclase (GGDEF)-like protein
MFGTGPRWRPGIKAKLYGAAVLSIIAVVMLSVASIHFARLTDIAADRFYYEGFEGVENSTRLHALLEQHRRIVESAPAEVDRERLDASRRSMGERNGQLDKLLSDLVERKSDPTIDAIESELAKKTPELMAAGEEVISYAYDFAHDKAVEAAIAYAATADEFERLLGDYRRRQLTLAHAAVLNLSQNARQLSLWVIFSALIALLLIGPVGLTVTRGVLGRLARITNYMTRLASQATPEEVPSRNDLDEVGNMARAVQVFKENGAELLERKRQLEEATLHRNVALNNMAHGLCMFDAKQQLIICNGRYASMYQLPPELTNAGTHLRAILDYRRLHGNLGERPEETLATLSATGPNNSVSFTKNLSDGRAISISRQMMHDGGWVAVHEDITERRRSEAQIAHLAHHDHLTNLPNRVFLREQLDDAVRHLQRGRKFAILCLDLDRFKGVNDSLGHPVGDALLKAVGKRLQECVQASDFVARLGGDEFAVIQSGVHRAEDCSDLAQRIIDSVSEPYLIEGHQAIVGASIGIAIAPVDGTSPDQLLKNADLAMYQAKADGRGAYRLFEPQMDAFIQQRRALELDLRHALSMNQLKLYYQPIVDTKLGKVIGFEALMRWFHPERGEVPPSEFVRLAEETGLISPLGEWVVRSACAEARNWSEHISVAVNLSSVQLKNVNLPQVILSALATVGLPASRLELEITESVLLENDTKTLAMLNQLRSLGVRIAMDDFGTGYSSLSYLQSFPLDKMKIDQSFIRNLTTKPEARAIVRAITSLARAFNIRVVAEGVETAEQVQILEAEGCTEFQGYYFGRPQPPETISGAISECGRVLNGPDDQSSEAPVVVRLPRPNDLNPRPKPLINRKRIS